MALLTLEPIARAEDLFSGLNPEEESQTSRTFSVRRSIRLDAIIEGYLEAIKNAQTDYCTETNYIICGEAVPQDYDSNDITQFSVVFPRFQIIKYRKYAPEDNYSGYYFSALINNCKGNEPIRLEMSHYENVLSSLGFRNRNRTIIINGNVGQYLGDEMKGGKIVLTGLAGTDIGYKMSGGEIIVNGDYPWVTLGTHLSGGVIRINGKIPELGGVLQEGGDIYHYDKLVVKNGEVVK